MTEHTGGVLPLGPGKQVGRYLIAKRLAYGGMAEIFLARDTAVSGISRHVVLKCIHPEILEDPSVVELFVDEIRIVARLTHENIAHVYDFGESDGIYYMVMEHVEGLSLRQLALTLLPDHIPIEHIVKIGSDIALALYHAHTLKGDDEQPLGIIHRDVSPQNILVSADGQVKLLDFGVAKAADQLHHTQVGTLRGKCAYMAPEQCLELPMDHRVDIFALGIVLHEVLSGRRLFKRETAVETIRAICTPSIKRPSAFRPQIPRRLDAIVLKALARKPDDRYQSADELSMDLAQVLQEEGLLSNQILLGRFVRSVLGVAVDAPETPAPTPVLRDDPPSTSMADVPLIEDDEHTEVDAIEPVGTLPDGTAQTPSTADAEPVTDAETPTLSEPATLVRGEPPSFDAFDEHSISTEVSGDFDVPTLVTDPPQELLIAALLEHDLASEQGSRGDEPGTESLDFLTATLDDDELLDVDELRSDELISVGDAPLPISMDSKPPQAEHDEPSPVVDAVALFELPDVDASPEPSPEHDVVARDPLPDEGARFELPLEADTMTAWSGQSGDAYSLLPPLRPRRRPYNVLTLVIAGILVIVLGAALGLLAWGWRM